MQLLSNATQYRGFDFVFGFLPAVFVGGFALTGMFLSSLRFISKNGTINTTVLNTFFFLSIGFLACLSLSAVIISEGRVKHKRLLIFLIAMGIIETIVVFVNFYPLLFSFILFPLSLIALVIVAVKYIIMLSRAGQKANI